MHDAKSGFVVGGYLQPNPLNPRRRLLLAHIDPATLEFECTADDGEAIGTDTAAVNAQTCPVYGIVDAAALAGQQSDPLRTSWAQI